MAVTLRTVHNRGHEERRAALLPAPRARPLRLRLRRGRRARGRGHPRVRPAQGPGPGRRPGVAGRPAAGALPVSSPRSWPRGVVLLVAALVDAAALPLQAPALAGALVWLSN